MVHRLYLWCRGWKLPPHQSPKSCHDASGEFRGDFIGLGTWSGYVIISGPIGSSCRKRDQPATFQRALQQWTRQRHQMAFHGRLMESVCYTRLCCAHAILEAWLLLSMVMLCKYQWTVGGNHPGGWGKLNYKPWKHF